MRFSRKRKLETGRLEIAPLVDVVLLLLIFFMLTSSFINRAGLRINLPQSSAAELQRKQSFTVSISEEEELFFENQPVPWEELRTTLVSRRARLPDRMLIIEADRSVRHGKVVEVMSLAKETGWERLAIAAQPPGKDVP